MVNHIDRGTGVDPQLTPPTTWMINVSDKFICGKGIDFVRIDGSTHGRDRQHAVLSFRSSTKVKIALIGITAGGVGLDFSYVQHVAFLELPQSPSLMLQATLTVQAEIH